MKRITLILVAVLTMGLTSVFAQKGATSFTGTITSKTTCSGTTDPNIIAQINGESTQMVCGNRTKIVQVQEGGLGIIQISNGDTKMAYVILDIPGMGKYYIETSGDSIAKGMEKIKTDYKYTCYALGHEVWSGRVLSWHVYGKPCQTLPAPAAEDIRAATAAMQQAGH